MNKNSFLYLCLLLSLLGFSTQLQAQSTRTAYYAIMPFWESPYVPFKGAYPISEKVAETRIHLRLVYDQQNRVSEAKVMLGKKFKEFEGISGSLAYLSPHIKVSYSENKETHHFYDRFGNAIAVMNDVFNRTYIKDENNRNIKLSFFNKEGKPATDFFKIHTYEWTHQSDGSIIETRKNVDGELVPLRGIFHFMKTRMVFGKDGYFSVLQNIDDQGNLVNSESGAAMFKYFYDDFGRFLKWEVYDKEGNKAIGPSSTAGEVNTFHKYDLADIIFFDTFGKPVIHWSGAERWHHEYDQYGNRVLREFQTHKQKAMNVASGYAKVKLKWSKGGQYLLSQAYFDETDKKVNHNTSGIHQMKYYRNKAGLLVKVEYLDTAGNLKNRKDTGAAYTIYEYNSNKMRISSSSFNTDGNKLL